MSASNRSSAKKIALPVSRAPLARSARPALSLGALAIVSGCSSTPPPGWASGGAPLAFKSAVWERDDDRIEIKDNGHVLEDGDLLFVIDRVGRVVDEDYEPVALILPDGNVAGPDNQHLGRVGVTNAAPPGYAAAWLSIRPDGAVVRFDSDGEQELDGRWHGCNGPQMRTCTLVTHLLAVRYYQNQPRSSVGVGIGIGL